jgi:hypothetical protein
MNIEKILARIEELEDTIDLLTKHGYESHEEVRELEALKNEINTSDQTSA